MDIHLTWHNKDSHHRLALYTIVIDFIKRNKDTRSIVNLVKSIVAKLPYIQIPSS